MNRISLSIFILFLLALGTMSVLGPNQSPTSSQSTSQHSQSPRPSTTAQSTFNPLLPLVGVFSSQYSNWNITDLTLTTGSSFVVQINVTNAPAFNGYEFALFFDQSYIQVSSYDLKAGIFNNPFAASQFNGNGTLRLAVVNLGPLITVSNGPLLNITFK